MMNHLHTKLALSTNVLYRNIIGGINLTNVVNVAASSMDSLYVTKFYQVVKLAKISPGSFKLNNVISSVYIGLIAQQLMCTLWMDSR